MLWEQTEYYKDRKMVWKIEDAYATQKDCATGLRATYREAEPTYGVGKGDKVTYHGKDRYSVSWTREGERDELMWTTRLCAFRPLPTRGPAERKERRS